MKHGVFLGRGRFFDIRFSGMGAFLPVMADEKLGSLIFA
jgi:hypothetical protein